MANWTTDGLGIHRLRLGAYNLSLVEKHRDYPEGVYVIHLMPGLIDTEPIGRIDTLTNARTRAIEIARGKLDQVYQDAMEALK